MTTTEHVLFGGQTMTGTLRRVLVRRPGATDRWRDYNWRSAPDPARLAAEHDALCAALAQAGADVVVASADAANIDAVYVFDPAIVCDAGALLLRPGKVARQAEVEPLAHELERAGVPVAARLEAPALAEGGDTMWLDERTLVVGRGFRTNQAGVEALGRALPGVDVLAFDLPYATGPADVLHLLSVISPLDRDLALVYLPLMPVGLYQLLAEREIELVEVADEEYATLGCNVLALGPRRALTVDGNAETRRRLEAAGVEVLTYTARELSKGDGGPTCLTRPLARS